jgi:raffinose/stachyose/melibiose transport system substrate-binding protein
LIFAAISNSNLGGTILKRNVGFIVALCLVMLSLYGCTSNKKAVESATPMATVAPTATDAPAAATEAPKEKKTVTFATITGYYSTALKEAAAAYTKLHPETDVKIDIIADNTAYKTAFDAKMAAGGTDAPDIIHTNLVSGTVGDTIADYVDKGWVLKLNDFVKEPNPYNGGIPVFDGIDPAYHKYSYDRNGNVVNLTFDLVGTGFFYNKDIFAKLGLAEPKTWEDLFAVAEKLKAAKYIPFTVPVAGKTLGWMQSAFVDWTSRALVPQVLILPGDARYDEKVHKVNTTIKYDASNPDFDFGAIVDPEKVLLAGKSKLYDNQGPAEKKYWTTLQTFSKYFQPGYQTMDDSSVYQLFLTQKAAIFWNGSWQVGSILADQKKLGDKSFKWGTFKFPGYATPDPLFPGDPRGILVPGHVLGITAKKDAEQVKRAEDFLKYLYSKDVAQKVMERTLQVGEFVQGPSLILGVKLPDEVNTYLTGFKVAGNMGYSFANIASGVNPDQEPAWNANEFKFFDGKQTVEQFLAAKAKFAQAAADKLAKDNKYDLDPKTNP